MGLVEVEAHLGVVQGGQDLLGVMEAQHLTKVTAGKAVAVVVWVELVVRARQIQQALEAQAKHTQLEGYHTLLQGVVEVNCILMVHQVVVLADRVLEGGVPQQQQTLQMSTLQNL